MTAVLDLPVRQDVRLAIDNGGSTLRLAVCDLDGKETESEKFPYPQQRFASLEEGIGYYLEKLGYRPALGVAGVAGPIEHRKVKLTNNPDWPIFDADSAERNLGVRIHLVNDMIIAAASIPALVDADVEVIRDGVTDHDAPALIFTLSTGVNDALCLPHATGIHAYVAAESGHTPFAPRSDIELELLKWSMHNGLEYVGWENVIAGTKGFQRVYDFVTKGLGVAPLPSTVEALAGDVPCGPPLTRAGLEDKDPAALKVFEIIGGITASYLASRVIATLAGGGVYLVGSIAQNRGLMQYYLDSSPFLERFAEAGPYGRLVVDVPILRVLHKEFGLLGASRIASQIHE